MYCTFLCLPHLCQQTCGEQRARELYLSLADVKSIGRHDGFNTRNCSCMHKYSYSLDTMCGTTFLEGDFRSETDAGWPPLLQSGILELLRLF